MKKMLLSIAAAALSASASAQYIIVNDDMPISINDIEKITYEADDQFEASLLPGRLANDPKTTIFSQALQLTGLADSLRAYIYDNYNGDSRYYQYKSNVHTEVGWYRKNRFKQFTVFVETDSVFAAKGINNLDQLKAYAKQVYDEAYPEDASVSNSTDRRNSLNRFVAYHILKGGIPYWYLTAYDNTSQGAFWLNTNLADMSAWYRTLIPYAALKCSYPMGNDKGLYLNRRGLKDGADKYGKQIRGAKILTDGEQGFDHKCFNGYYFHIDDLLTYGKKTQEEVLSTELWRVDFKTLSPDIMNNADELRGNYLREDGNGETQPDKSPNPKNGRNYIYEWDGMENIKGDTARNHIGLVARRAHYYYWSWQGDEINVFGDYDMTIKLPPVPAGEWEVRMGICTQERRGAARIYLNGQVTIDSLIMRYVYYGSDLSFYDAPFQPKILEYMTKTMLSAVKTDDGKYLVSDLKTGEQLLVNSSFFSSYENRGYYYAWGNYKISNFTGTNPSSGETEDWSQRVTDYRELAKNDYFATFPKCMRGPRECTIGNGYNFANINNCVRYPLGRIISDGKSDNYLRIENLPDSIAYNVEAQFDYFELVPKFVYDNQEIPEE